MEEQQIDVLEVTARMAAVSDVPERCMPVTTRAGCVLGGGLNARMDKVSMDRRWSACRPATGLDRFRVAAGREYTPGSQRMTRSGRTARAHGT
jgi:hypothetical protein